MKPFLKELTEQILSKVNTLEGMTFVFPNQRSIIYFQHYLSHGLNKPEWSPTTISIEAFFKKHSNLKELEKLALIFRLYEVYKKIANYSESFDQFYFWGQILLSDFNDIDKQLVNGKHLYSDLREIKEIESSFDYLTEKQIELLKTFWERAKVINSAESTSINVKKKFLTLWNHLSKVYETFVSELKREGLGYVGMIYKEVAENFINPSTSVLTDSKHIMFVGFNGISKAEEIVISHCIESGAQIFWDLDSYYVDQKIQEAGLFFRQYQNHQVLGKTFPHTIPAFLKESSKEISLTGAPQRISQAKLVGEKLMEILSKDNDKSRNEVLSDTVIVLPDPQMLLPIIRSLPKSVQQVNVTMGFPIGETKLYNLLNLVIDLQTNQQGEFGISALIAKIVNHVALTELISVEDKVFIKKIISEQKIDISFVELQSRKGIFSLIFQKIKPKDATSYLLEIIHFLGTSYSKSQGIEKESAYHLYNHLSNLNQLITEQAGIESWEGFQKLFHYILINEKIPFKGEPVRGLQIMGIFETQSLDFKNVIVVSMNEGKWPASSNDRSYIPHSIRKAYGLPTSDYQDVVYSYLFYRLIQRAENISFYYCTEPDVLGIGEMSRYLNQLLLESGLPLKKYILHNKIKSLPTKEIIVNKTTTIQKVLNQYIVCDNIKKKGRQLSPTSLNDYIECPLRFFLKHLVGLKEPDKLISEPDASLVGELIHKSLFLFYKNLCDGKKELIHKQQLLEASSGIEKIIDQSFSEINIRIKGQWIIVKEIINRFVEKVIEQDLENTPFEIIQLEGKVISTISLTNGSQIQLKGIIDRVDRRNSGFTIIDYKTGVDEIRFNTVSELTDHNLSRNKAAFQAFFYSLIFDQTTPNENSISAGIYGRKNLFTTPFKHLLTLKNEKIENIKPLLIEFKSNLVQLLEELLNPSIPFVQTSNKDTCLYCPYKSICRR